LIRLAFPNADKGDAPAELVTEVEAVEEAIYTKKVIHRRKWRGKSWKGGSSTGRWKKRLRTLHKISFSSKARESLTEVANNFNARRIPRRQSTAPADCEP
jgi:hypothetical protein